MRKVAEGLQRLTNFARHFLDEHLRLQPERGRQRGLAHLHGLGAVAQPGHAARHEHVTPDGIGWVARNELCELTP